MDTEKLVDIITKIIMELLKTQTFSELKVAAENDAPNTVSTCTAAKLPCCSRQIDMRGKRLVHERDLRERNTARGDTVLVDRNVIITALAHDYAKNIGAKFSKED